MSFFERGRSSERGEAAKLTSDEAADLTREGISCESAAGDISCLHKFLPSFLAKRYDDVSTSFSEAEYEEKDVAEACEQNAEDFGKLWDAAKKLRHLQGIIENLPGIDSDGAEQLFEDLRNGDGALITLKNAMRADCLDNYLADFREKMINNGLDYHYAERLYEEKRFASRRDQLAKLFPPDATGLDLTQAKTEAELDSVLEAHEADIDSFFHGELTDSSCESPIEIRIMPEDGATALEGGPLIIKSTRGEGGEVGFRSLSRGVVDKTGRARKTRDGVSMRTASEEGDLYGNDAFAQAKLQKHLESSTDFSESEKDDASCAIEASKVVQSFIREYIDDPFKIGKPFTGKLSSLLAERFDLEDEGQAKLFRKTFAAASSAIKEFEDRAQFLIDKHMGDGTVEADARELAVKEASGCSIVAISGEGDFAAKKKEEEKKESVGGRKAFKEYLWGKAAALCEKARQMKGPLGVLADFAVAPIDALVGDHESMTKLVERSREVKTIGFNSQSFDLPDFTTVEGSDLFEKALKERGITKLDKEVKSEFPEGGKISMKLRMRRAFSVWNELDATAQKGILSGRVKRGNFSPEVVAAVEILSKEGLITLPHRVIDYEMPDYEPTAKTGAESMKITIFDEQIEKKLDGSLDSRSRAAKVSSIKRAIEVWNGIDESVARKVLHNRDVTGAISPEEMKAICTLMNNGLIQCEKRVFANDADRLTTLQHLDVFASELELSGVDFETLSDEQIQEKLTKFDTLRADVIASARSSEPVGGINGLDRRKVGIILKTNDSAKIDEFLNRISRYNSIDKGQRIYFGSALALAASESSRSTTEYIDGLMWDEGTKNMAKEISRDCTEFEELNLIEGIPTKISMTAAEIEEAINNADEATKNELLAKKQALDDAGVSLADAARMFANLPTYDRAALAMDGPYFEPLSPVVGMYSEIVRAVGGFSK